MDGRKDRQMDGKAEGRTDARRANGEADIRGRVIRVKNGR